MAANPSPAEEMVNVFVDGVPAQGRKGAMIIHVTDANNAYVPRFCYHDKLPIAANCRMCLVEVEKAPKPLPACATPITEGMKIFTKSPNAIAAQKATMEFLLINHPLDCPICDQGGECELQDLAMGFGRDASRFHERKRVVKDKNLGPLVSTDMTRCIHCTRCVRFGQDIAGIQELGTMGRGENMEIGTYIERSVDHELSGNIIDLCPVGALNSKPFRYQARSWEMTQHALVSPHDGLGTNLYGHVLRGKLMRMVPRANESINEAWIADRDRFSYEGIYSPDRLLAPMIREGSQWRTADWQQALEATAEGLKSHVALLGALASPSATTEEFALLARIMRGLGSPHIDHRLRQRDFRDAGADPLRPDLGLSIADVESLQGLLIVGSHLRHDLPLLAHRVRKAARRGARIALLDATDHEYLFPVAARLRSTPAEQVLDLAAVVIAAAQAAAIGVPQAAAALAESTPVTDAHRALAAALMTGDRRAVWLGAQALRHPAYADLRALAAALCAVSGATLGVLAEGGNAAGAWLAGALPHREPGGRIAAVPGRNAAQMLDIALSAYILFGGIDPGADTGAADALRALGGAEFVVAMTPFASDELKRVAHVLLPIGTFAETSGTYVNLEGQWQSWAGAAKLVGEARPGWKVLRVLGNLLGLAGFDYNSSDEVMQQLKLQCAASTPAPLSTSHEVQMRANETAAKDATVKDVPMYEVDSLVRRSLPLQLTKAGQGHV